MTIIVGGTSRDPPIVEPARLKSSNNRFDAHPSSLATGMSAPLIRTGRHFAAGDFSSGEMSRKLLSR
jgi:hypothetical protein